MARGRAAGVVCVWSLCAGLAATPVAHAYSYESPISDGCHEQITQEAFQRVREEFNVPRIEPTDMERALIADLPFAIARDMRDVAGATLLIGVRDNDLKGLPPLEASELALIHGDPDGQDEHCLRRPEHDGASGSEAALAACREYVRDSVVHAITRGMDAMAARPDPDQRTYLRVYLSFAGAQWPDLPVFYVYMGQALHTLQDAFTHTFRTEDGRRVTTVLNWIDFAENDHRERRDGPPHEAALDQCRDIDDFREGRVASALEASTDLLRAALDPSTDAAQKMIAVDEVLAKWMEFEGGCDFDNRWCDAPERSYSDPTGCTCSAPGAAPRDRSNVPLALVFAALAIAARRSRRARKRTLAGALLACLLASSASTARAQDAPPDPPSASPPRAEAPVEPSPVASDADADADADRDTASVTEPRRGPSPEADTVPRQERSSAGAMCVPGRVIECPCRGAVRGLQTCLSSGRGFGACDCAVFPGERESGLPLGVSVAVGGAIDHTAVAASVGARYAWAEEWIVGLDVEFNPWASFDTKRFQLGTLNIYATLIRRYPINPNVSLRTSAHAGLSILLFDLFGAPRGSVGAYLGLSLIGVELNLAKDLILVVDPADVAYAIPHLSGAPLSYRQYRLTVALQWGGLPN